MATKKVGTAVAVKKASSGAVMSIQARITAMAEANKNKIDQSGSAIRVSQDKKMNVPGQGETEEVDLVVVEFLSTQNFYPDGFDPKNLVPPDCFAIGEDPKNLTPSPNSPNLQVKPGQSCKECKQFQWGSDPKGDGKACKSGRKLAVLSPDADKDTPMLTLGVSPTGLKSFDGFIAGLNRIGSIPVAHIVHVDFNPAVKYPSLRFTNPVVNTAVETHLDRMDEAKVLLNNEPDVSGWAEKKKTAKASTTKARR